MMPEQSRNRGGHNRANSTIDWPLGRRPASSSKSTANSMARRSQLQKNDAERISLIGSNVSTSPLRRGSSSTSEGLFFDEPGRCRPPA